MKYINFIKLFFLKIISDIAKINNRVNYQIQNPTCNFHDGVILINSQLEGMNVIFNDSHLISTFLGKHSYVQKKSTIINAEIGKYCSIASNVCIGPGLHKTDGVSTHPSFYLKNTPLVKTYTNDDLFVSNKKSIIGHDVWIGTGVIIIDGVTIGHGAIIAAGAVVTKNVKPYEVVGGVPAKHIRNRFSDEVINVLIKSEWWNKTDEWFNKNYKLMLDPNEFINYL